MSPHIIRQCLISVCMLVSYCSMLVANDHQHILSENQFFNHIGKLHFILNHFPFALVTLTVFIELLNRCLRTLFINSAPRFLIYGAAFLALPSILTGLVLAYGVLYAHDVENIFLSYLILGIVSMVLTIAAAIFKQKKWRKSYFTTLTFAFVGIIGTTYL